MLLKLEIELSKDIEKDLNRSLEDVTAEIVRTVAEDAPIAMALMMPEGAGKSSVKGNPPNRQSGNLARSLKGIVTSPSTAEIELADYGQFLDSDLGGSLERNFVIAGIERSLQKNL